MQNNTNLKFRYASLAKRFIAFLIDGSILYLNVFFILKFGFNFEFYSKIITPSIFYIILWYLFLIYFIFFNMVLKGQTYGYKLMNIKLVSLTGYEPKIWQYVLRAIFISVIAVPILNKLVLLIAITWLLCSIALLLSVPTKERKQTLWDLATKTFVIEVEKRTNHS